MTRSLLRWAALGVALLACASDARAATLIGDALPAVTLPALSGAKVTKKAKPVALNKLGAGVLVFSFYSKYCRSCRVELPALRRAVVRANKGRAKGERARVFVIVIDEAPPLGARQRLGKQTRWLLDAKGAARRAFVPRRFPCTYIAKGQRVRKINRGYGRGYERRVEGWLRALMARSPQRR